MTKDNRFNDAEIKIQEALALLALVDNGSKKNKKKTDRAEGVIDREYRDYWWSNRYVRTHEALLEYGEKIIVHNEQGDALIRNMEALDAFHANLDRLTFAINNDLQKAKKNDPKNPPRAYFLEKNGKDIDKGKVDTVEKITKSLEDIKTSFNKDPLLRDVSQITDKTGKKITDIIYDEQYYYDRGIRLLNKLDSLYTQTVGTAVQGGSPLEGLPIRRKGEGIERDAKGVIKGEGGRISETLDQMRETLNGLYDKEQDTFNRGIIIQDPGKRKAQIKAFDALKNTLSENLKIYEKELEKAPLKTPERTLRDEISLMQRDIKAFESSLSQDFKKTMDISTTGPAKEGKKVSALGIDSLLNREGGVLASHGLALDDGVRIYTDTEAGALAVANIPRKNVSTAPKKPGATTVGLT